jgi:hypothetical protein
MDAETKRWFAHLDNKLDKALALQQQQAERIVRLEEHRNQADLERMRTSARLDAHSLSLRDFERGKAKIAGIAAGIGAAVPVVAWLVQRLVLGA